MASKYVEIYNELKKQIEAGKHKIGQCIPSEGELMEAYDVSRDTVRKALGMLENEGYIQKSRGKAAVVVEKKDYKFPFSDIASFKELNQNLGRKTETEVENLEILTDRKRIRGIFEEDNEKELYELFRVRKIDGEHVIIDHDYFKRSIVPNLPLRACRDSVYQYLEEELNIHIGYASKEISVESATDEDKRYLDMKEFNLVIVVKSYTYMSDGCLFQYTESRHRPDHFHFVGFAQRKI